ncbi:unnamed protein product [Echinostoma caproni]|uniref:GRAM domain-containing protein n=1 Tax=Echinostoma caproni TaxID=27848 RepID=A0A183AGE5_9TREM|nr:unnamed protein product [Echinostoma caproni]
MSLNQSHQAGVGSVLLFYGERLLIFYDGCDLKLGPPLKGNHMGRVYLTSHRGEAEFKMTFKRGGAIEFAQALIDLGKRACAAKQNFRAPPPYTPMDMNGAGQFYSCPPPAYAPPYNDPYYGFIKPHEAFTPPPPSSLYHVGAPPPYPGAAPQTANSWPSAPPYPQAAGYPPPPSAVYDGSGAVGGNVNSSDAPMSAAHAAKAAEAAASASNAVTGGYYFREDPHNVYVPPGDLPPPYPSAPGAESSQPPPYPGTNPQEKKNQ